VQLGELQEYYAKFRHAGVQVVAVSVDPPAQNARLKARLGAGYEFLSDIKGELLDALDIRQSHASMTGEDVAIPTQYLLDRDGIVRWFHRADTWRVRPRPEEALRAIQRLAPKTELAATPAS
jgi:peroxiredoxin